MVSLLHGQTCCEPSLHNIIQPSNLTFFLYCLQLQQANIVVFNYSYMLDPKVAEMVSKDFSKKSVVVFDEAHNIGMCLQTDLCTMNFDSYASAR